MEIAINTLAAMKLFAAKNDARHYLNGVLLELGSRESRLVATNGRMIAIMRLCVCRPGPMQRIILPNAALAGVRPSKKSALATIEIDGADNVVRLRIETPTWQWAGDSIDGAYPDYLRVLPRRVSGEMAQFDGEYLGTFHRAAEILRSGLFRYPTIGHNGTSGALVDIGRDDFVGVIMPIFANSPPTEAPEWANQRLDAVEAAA